jgi:transposase-like protein
LTARRLSGVKLVISDSHHGLVAAIGAALLGAAWQRCRTHYRRNPALQVSKTAQPCVATLFRTVFDQPDADAVRQRFARVVTTIEAKFPTAAEHVDDVPREIWRQIGVERPARTAEEGNPPPHRRRRDPPEPRPDHPPRRRVLTEQNLNASVKSQLAPALLS